MDAIPAFIAEWGPTGLLTLTVVMVLTGQLVPRRTYEDQVKATAWYRDAYERRTEAYFRLAEPTAQAAVSAFNALPPPPREPEES